ncbi:hypothetical protein [Streptosporangium sp. 'caverna']|uniref:hypothetical protein n=1 Tax=Streptosporangium sp. 'caverna' TaxID=2202249 RepID=UPI000D7DBBD9|nr:hypothetical protein [Streptosporangium sp. 'caverna']AWS43795.1 hypothetical protein DKM19_23025 [Streptosporangium sp. 'caverna']
MMVAAVLASYAMVAVVVLPRLLSREEWAERAPRLAIAVWLAACASVVASAIFSALAVAIPASVIGHGLAGFFEACADVLSDGAALNSPVARAALAGPV